MSLRKGQTRIKSTWQALNPYEICRQLKDKGINRVVLSFSGGKDSIAAWCVLKDCGIRVVPLHFDAYIKCALEDRVMEFYENFFSEKIHRVWHTGVYDSLGQALFKEPWQCGFLQRNGMIGCHKAKNDGQGKALEAITRRWMQDNGEVGTMITKGAKRDDSMQRGLKIIQFGQINWKANYCLPVSGCTNGHIVQILNDYGCPLPSQYLAAGQSFDLVTPLQLQWVKDNDYESYLDIMAEFPLAELMQQRIDIGKKSIISI